MCVCVVRVWCACMFVCVRLHLSVEHTFSGVHVLFYLLACQVSVTICDLDLCCCVHNFPWTEFPCNLFTFTYPHSSCPLPPVPYTLLRCAAGSAGLYCAVATPSAGQRGDGPSTSVIFFTDHSIQPTTCLIPGKWVTCPLLVCGSGGGVMCHCLLVVCVIGDGLLLMAVLCVIVWWWWWWFVSLFTGGLCHWWWWCYVSLFGGGLCHWWW